MLKQDLTVGDERTHLINQTIPMIWGIFAILGMNLADTFFVGQLGTDQLAAMGFTFPVVMIMSSLAFGIGTGASSVMARAIGSKQDDRVRSYSTQSLILALIVAILFAITGLLTVDPLFRLLGAPERLLPLVHDYMDIWYLGCFLVVVPMVGNAGIRAAGNSKLPSYVMFSVAIVNLILDPIFIFGWFGFPRMELQGAALATIIAYSVSFIAALYVLRVKLNFLTWDACQQRVWASWRDILRIGIPASATNLISPVSIAITTWMVAQYGSEAVAGYGVASRIETFSLIVLMALSVMLAPFAGQNWGAGKVERLQRALSLSFRFSWIWGIAMAVLLWLGAEWLTGWFTEDAVAVDSAVSYLRIVPVTFALLGIVMMVSSVANGVGEPVPALVMTLTRLVLIYLPLAWLLSRWLGVDGIYLATAAANTLVGAGAWWWSIRKCSGKPVTQAQTVA